MNKFEKLYESISTRSKLSKSEYTKMDNVVSLNAINEMAKGVRLVSEDLMENDFQVDKNIAYLHILLDKIIKDG